MSSDRGDWKIGVAFVKGINMFSNARITKKKMLELCRKVEDKNIQIEDIFKTDNIIFKKRKVHYATVGQKLEKILTEHFEKQIHITTRSMSTIDSIASQHGAL